MGTGGLLFCLVLFVVVVRIGSRSVLNTLEDLRDKTTFGKHFPRKGLLLLCWLLSESKINQNGELYLNFNPAEETHPFGFHHYKNREGVFPDMSNTHYEYYSLGNMHFPNSKQLPDYIFTDFHTSLDHPQVSTDRVVIKIQENNVDNVLTAVYITEHSENKRQGSAYVKELTHQISKLLLKEIAELCRPVVDYTHHKPHKDDPDLLRFYHIQSLFPNDTHLHWFLYLAGYNSETNISEGTPCNCPDKSKTTNDIKLDLVSTPDGRARIVWHGIPVKMLKKKIRIGVYNDDEDTPLVEYALNGRAFGEIDTHLALNPGLHLSLLKPITIFEAVYESPKFDESKSENGLIEPSEATKTPYFSISVVSLLFYPFHLLFSLVYFILSTLFYVVYFIVSIFFTLVRVIVSILFTLVRVIVSILISLFIFICQTIFYAFAQVISLTVFISYQLFSLILSIMVSGVIAIIISVLAAEMSELKPNA